MNRIHNFLTLVIFTSIALCSTTAFAQNDPVSVHVELSRSRVYVGDDLTYQIIIRGVNNPPTPTVEFPASVRATFRGRSSQSFTTMKIIQGRKRSVTDRKFTFQYILTAIDVGDISIPAPTITVNGKQHRGHETSFESVFPLKSDTDYFEMEIDRNALYLNETIDVQCTWWIGAKTSEFSFASTVFPESFDVHGMELESGSAQRVGFKIHNHQIVGVLLTDDYNGTRMDKLVFRFQVTPTQIGVFDLGPIRTVFTRHSGTGGSYRAYVESEPIVIDVQSIPTVNQPHNYDGAMGSFELFLNASNLMVNVGDPILLTLTITGDEPMAGIDNAPSTLSNSDFSSQFKVSSEGWRETLPRQAGERTYETTIRALNAQVNSIPAIDLPSFDPVAGVYRTFQSEPIDITVRPVQEITLSDAIIVGKSATPSQQITEHTRLAASAPGMWAHASAESMLTHSSPTLRWIQSSPILWIGAIASGPSLLVCSLIIAYAGGTHHPRRRELRQAWKRSRSLAHQGRHAQAWRVYLGAALSINENAVTSMDAYQLPICKDDASIIAACISTQEQNSYQGDAHQSDYKDRFKSEFLNIIHKQIKVKGEWS